jgi:hypothetical protein
MPMGCYDENGGKRTGENFLHAGICQDNISVKCATTFSDTLWKESANQEVYLHWYKCEKSWIIDLTSTASDVGLTIKCL